MKKKLMAIVLVLGIFLVGSLNANAATWATVSIDAIGPNVNKSVITVTDASTTPAIFTEKWLKLLPDMSKEMLAVALTAAALDSNLIIRIMDDGVTIDTMYLEP